MPESYVFIPMPDGVRLAATLYLPKTEPPWPALLEALPYRRDDLSSDAGTYRRLRDEATMSCAAWTSAAPERPKASRPASTSPGAGRPVRGHRLALTDLVLQAYENDELLRCHWRSMTLRQLQ